MAAAGKAPFGSTSSDEENDILQRIGFAKLQGEDFYYRMQKYSILLGRDGSSHTNLDVDLAHVGGSMGISRVHARIYYDFPRCRFALEVLGKNGCYVEGVHHPRGCPPVKLDSQDLLQIGNKKFYFLLPVRSITDGRYAPRRGPHAPPPAPSRGQMQMILSSPPPIPVVPGLPGESTTVDKDTDGVDDDRDGDKVKEEENDGHEEEGGATGHGRVPVGVEGKAGYPSKQPAEEKTEYQSRTNKEEDRERRTQLEEKEVIAGVASALSDLCGPGEWATLRKVHSVVLERFGEVWHRNTVRRYLTSEDWPSSAAKGREWVGLLALVRKYPEHFVINTTTKGNTTIEFVSLVSLME